MNANPPSIQPPPLPSSSSHDLRRRASRVRRARVRAAVMCALTAASAVLRASAASAGAPPFGADREVDAFDLFLDRARGDRVTDEPRAGALALGATASFGASPGAPPSFGILGFVQVPFDRIFADRRHALLTTAIADRPAAPAPSTPAVTRTPRAAPQAPASDRGARSGTSSASAPPADRMSRTSVPGASPPADRTSRTSAPGASPPADRTSRALVPEPSAAPADRGSADADGGSLDVAPEVSPPPPLLTPELARGAVRAACKAAKLDEADARLDSLASRAKVSALLPELRLRATRAIDETESLVPTEYDASRRTASGSATTWLEARATFRLDRLVFADDEIAVERQRMARAAERTKLVTRVLALLDAWQRARTAEADPETPRDARLDAILSETAAEASLDVLTDGWFSKAIELDDGAAPASRDAAAPALPAARSSQQRDGSSAEHEGAPASK